MSHKKPKKPLSHAAMVAQNRITRKSKMEHPIEGCWEIFFEHQAEHGDKISRKAAIDDCIAQGAAFYTARTQWQEWRKAGKAPTVTIKINGKSITKA